MRKLNLVFRMQDIMLERISRMTHVRKSIRATSLQRLMHVMVLTLLLYRSVSIIFVCVILNVETSLC